MPAGTHVAASRALPALAAPLANAPGQCNAGVPADSTLSRFAFIVSFLASNKFHVVRRRRKVSAYLLAEKNLRRLGPICRCALPPLASLCFCFLACRLM